MNNMGKWIGKNCLEIPTKIEFNLSKKSDLGAEMLTNQRLSIDIKTQCHRQMKFRFQKRSGQS